MWAFTVVCPPRTQLRRCELVSLVEALHRTIGHAYIDLLLHEPVRNTVVVLMHFYVVVDVNPCFLPLGINVPVLRQRTHGRAILRLKPGSTTAIQLLKRFVVELL